MQVIGGGRLGEVIVGADVKAELVATLQEGFWKPCYVWAFGVAFQT